MGEPRLSWGCAVRAHPDESTVGDLAVVHPLPGGAVVAALDGAGHGPDAAHAAATAAGVVHRLAGAPPAEILAGCHQALRRTRGAAIAVAVVSTRAATVTWAAVGDVSGVVLEAARGGRPSRWLRMPGGVAGHAFPEPVPDEFGVHNGDAVVLATDGIRPVFTDDLELAGRPQQIAEGIVDRHWTGTDDGLALVVRVLGAQR